MLKANVETMKKQMLAKTVIVSAIEDKEDEDYSQTETKMQSMAKELGLNCIDIDLARRMGRYKEGRHRLIELQLLRQKDKYALLKAQSNLMGIERYRNVYINEALTEEEMKNRKRFREFVKNQQREDTSTKFR